MSDQTIENLLSELRTFDPPDTFRAEAVVKSRDVYEEAERDFEAFWANQAWERIDWNEPWERILDWDPPFAKWFPGAKLNVSHNCLDRHVSAGFGDKIAYYWEGEPGDREEVTYAGLLELTCRIAN